MANTNLIKLGIAMEYPIEWSFEKVLIDMAQNFYDSIGENDFGKEFVIKKKRVRDKTIRIIMETKGHDFSCEWLNYIGGSTKTNISGRYIGKYGEGFKMCMLSLLIRGSGLCKMESRDWVIKPCTYEEKVSDTMVRMLGYKYSKRKDDGFTRFTADFDIDGYYYYHHVAKNILLNFYYRENKLFKGRVVENSAISIYKRSKVKCPTDYEDKQFKGILYINGLARARLDIPFAINLKEEEMSDDTRGRDVIKRYKANRLVIHASEKLDGRASYLFLLAMREYWDDIPDTINDVDSWYYLICNLVRNVAASKRYKNLFMRQYPELYYVGRRTSDRRNNRIIRETKAFARVSGYDKWCEFNPIFRLLGAQSLVEMYEHSKDYLYRDCAETEHKKVELVFDVFEKIYPKGYLYKDRPIVMISKDTSTTCDPLQFAIPDYSRTSRRKYIIKKLIIKEDDLVCCDIIDVLQLFYVKLIWAYCAERSEKRAHMLTDFGETVIRERSVLSNAQRGWEECLN